MSGKRPSSHAPGPCLNFRAPRARSPISSSRRTHRCANRHISEDHRYPSARRELAFRPPAVRVRLADSRDSKRDDEVAGAAVLVVASGGSAAAALTKPKAERGEPHRRA